MTKKSEVPSWLIRPPKQFHGEALINPHGTGEPMAIKVVFIHMSKPDALEWWEEAKKSERLAVDILSDIISGFVDEQGNEQPAKKEDFIYLLDNFPMPYADLVNAWFDNLKGARLKN